MFFLCFIGAQINAKTDEETNIGFSFTFTPPKERRKKNNYVPLSAAIMCCHPEVFSLLISRGAKIDIKMPNNETFLHEACDYGTLDMVKTLVNNGSCINAKTCSGHTPLFYCLRYAQPSDGVIYWCGKTRNSSDEDNFQEEHDIMEYLIKKGATLSWKDVRGRTPLECAMMTHRTISTFILLKYGGRISGEHLDKFPLNRRTMCANFELPIPNVHLIRLLLRSNFEFRRFLPVYLEQLRDLISTESFLTFLKEVEQPLSLKDQCRISIRNMIYTDTGVQFIRSINTLGLPKLLQGFLMFDDFDQSLLLTAENDKYRYINIDKHWDTQIWEKYYQR